MPVPNTFATATTSIPLSQLDQNFATTITLGNTAIQLGNTVTTLNNMTLANVTISSVASIFPNNYLANSAVTIGNTSVSLGSTQTSFGNVTLTNVTISSVSTPITVAQGGTGLSTLTAENVLIGNAANAIKVVAPGTTGNVLTSTGTTWSSQAPGAASGNITLGNTTISLGGTATSVGNLTLTNTTVTNYTETRFTANSSTAITLNLTNGTMQDITLTGSATITMPTAVAGKSFILLLRSGAGSYAVTWSTVKWPGGTAPTVTTTASRLDIYSFFSDGTNWYGVTVNQNYTP